MIDISGNGNLGVEIATSLPSTSVFSVFNSLMTKPYTRLKASLNKGSRFGDARTKSANFSSLTEQDNNFRCVNVECPVMAAKISSIRNCPSVSDCNLLADDVKDFTM